MQAGELKVYVQDKLAQAGVPEPMTETQVIFREILGLDRVTLLAHPEREIPEEDCARINEITDRRLMREPLQYILGSWNFMGLDFCVREGVLIPRPDTEVLVESALKCIHDGMRILDLCTGTGCVIISLMKYTNDTRGTGVDIAPEALELAARNGELILGQDPDKEKKNRLEIIDSDLYENVNGIYDVIVSNPPYINTAVIETLEPEVRDYEPHLALDGGIDGLDLIKRIVSGAGDHLTGGGALLMETGYDQGERVSGLMEEAGFTGVECIKDYAGLDRVVKGIKRILP